MVWSLPFRTVLRRRQLVCLVALVGAFVALPATAGAYVYWANAGIPGSGPGSTIDRASLDGSNQTTLVTVSADGNGNQTAPCGVTVDAGHLYWGNAGANIGGDASPPFPSDSIGEAPLGGGTPSVFASIQYAFGLSGYNAVTCGAATDGTYIYVSQPGYNVPTFNGDPDPGDGGVILRYSIADPSAVPAVYSTYTSERNPGDIESDPCGIAVDANYIYWADSDHASIGRMHLDGSDPQPDFISGLGAGPCGVAVDANHIYWSNLRGAGTDGVGTTIGRANLDGSGVNNSFITGADGACGTAVQTVGQDEYLYWGNYGDNGDGTTIGRATLTPAGDLAGTQAQAVDEAFIAISGTDGPCGVAVDGTAGPAAGSTPTAAVAAVSDLTNDSVTLNGFVNPDGKDTTYHFEYGKTTSYGTSAPFADADAGSGTTNIPVAQAVSNLVDGTTYHYAIVAMNASGPVTSDDGTFTTDTPGKPQDQISTPTNIQTTTASVSGTVNADGLDTSYYFAYTPDGGQEVDTPMQDAGAGYFKTNVSADLTGLSPDTEYTVTLHAVNSAGSDTSHDTFTTVDPYTLPVASGPPTIQALSSSPLAAGSTLQCDGPTFTADPGDAISINYQWLRDGHPISEPSGPGADSSTMRDYKLTTSDYGVPITCEVSATDTAGTSAPIVSSNSAQIAVNCEKPRIDSFSETNPNASEGDHPGGTVTVAGSGFCAGDEITVGGGLPTTATANPAGTALTFTIPPTATPGTFTVSFGPVTTGGQTFTATSNAPVNVVNFTSTDGFSFRDYIAQLQYTDMTNEFGESVTYDNHCSGGVCRPTPDYDAMTIYNNFFGGTNSPTDTMAGMAILASRVDSGLLRISGIPSNGSDTLYGLNGPSGPSPALETQIDALETSLASTHIQQDWLAASQTEAGSQEAASPEGQIASILAQGRYPIVLYPTNGVISSLSSGGGWTAVDWTNFTGVAAGVIYGTESLTPGTCSDGESQACGSYDAYWPYAPAPASPGADNLSLANVQTSNGWWSTGYAFSFGTPLPTPLGPSSDQFQWQGGANPLVVIDPVKIGGQANLDTNLAAAATASDAQRLGPDEDTAPQLGYVISGGALNPNAPASDPGQISQVTDAAGNTLLAPGGLLNLGTTGLQGAVMPLPSGGSPDGRPPLVLLPTGVGNFTAAVTDTGTGTVDHAIYGPNFAASASTNGVAGATQTLSIGPESIGETTSNGGQPVNLSLATESGGTTQEIASADTTSSANGSDTMSFMSAGAGVKIAHTGPAATVSLTVSADGGDQTFSSGPISLGANGTATVTGIRSGLSGSAATVTVGGRSRRVRNHFHAAKLAGIASVRAKPAGSGTVALTIVRSHHALAAGSLVTFSWTVRAGSKTVASHVVTVPAGSGAAQAFTVPVTKRTRYKLTATVVVTTTQSGVESSTHAIRKLGFTG